MRIPFRKYITVNILGQFIWSGALLSVGYLFGESYTRIDSVAGKAFVVLVFLAALYGLYRYAKSVRAKLLK